MTTITATEVWTLHGERAVQVQTSRCSYRVVLKGEHAHILAPGLNRVIELDDEFYPTDDEEVCAIMLVAQIEGGIEI